MSREIRAFTCDVPALTVIGAPKTFDLTFPPRVVDTIEIVVPPGPSGVVGFYIANSDVRVIPYDSDEFMVMSNEKVTWPLDGYITSGSWQLTAYNTGTLNHSIYVRFLLSLTGTTTAAGPALISTDALNSPEQPPFTSVVTIGA